MCSWGLTSLGRPDYDLLLLWRCWNDCAYGVDLCAIGKC